MVLLYEKQDDACSVLYVLGLMFIVRHGNLEKSGKSIKICNGHFTLCRGRDSDEGLGVGIGV